MGRVLAFIMTYVCHIIKHEIKTSKNKRAVKTLSIKLDWRDELTDICCQLQDSKANGFLPRDPSHNRIVAKLLSLTDPQEAHLFGG